jgi:putative nucleotidyltransferase with HDIG domain
MPPGDLRARLKSHIDRLPVLPMVLARLMTLDPDHDGFFDEVMGLLEGDPPFAARILSAANAATSGHLRPVASVRSALLRLGSQGAANAITTLAVTRVFVPRTDWEKSLWRHSIHVGAAMRVLADMDRSGVVDHDVAYAAGLLHDVGRLIIFQEAPDALHQIDEGGWHTPEALVDAERAICGIGHAELGARACRRWNLPDILVDVVARHHHPIHNPVGEAEVLVAMTRFADLIMFPSAMPGTPGRERDTDAVLAADLVPQLPPQLVHLGPGDLRRVIVEANSRADRIGSSVGM